MNARRLMYKLQAALCAEGNHVSINQRQHWSDAARRMVTIYDVRDGQGDTICKTYRPVEVIQALARKLDGGDAG